MCLDVGPLTTCGAIQYSLFCRINHIILVVLFSKEVPPEVCGAWFAYQSSSTLSFLDALNPVLMLKGILLRPYDPKEF